MGRYCPGRLDSERLGHEFDANYCTDDSGGEVQCPAEPTVEVENASAARPPMKFPAAGIIAMARTTPHSLIA